MSNETRSSRALPTQLQFYVLGGLAIIGLVAIFVFLAGAGSGVAQNAEPRLISFTPNQQQRASLQIQPVAVQIFHTEIVTDGYVVPNGGFAAPGASSEGRIAHGLPVLTGQSSDLLQAESDLVTANAQFRVAQSNEKRQHALYDTDGAALKDWQQAQADRATAAASLASARNRLRVLGKTNSEIAQFEGNAGRNASSDAVFSVGDLSTVWLVANVREADAAIIRIGDAVEVRIPAFPDTIFKAQVSYISSVIDPATHRLVVGAALRNPGSRLKPNMQAAFTILSGASGPAPAVPQNAVIYEGDTAKVWVADKAGALKIRTIVIGRINGNLAEVTKGLSAGERIVTGGALFLDQASSNG